MSKVFNAENLTMTVKMGDGNLDSLLTTLEEVPQRLSNVAGALDILARGFESGFFEGQDFRVAGLFALLARGMHFLAEEEGELLLEHVDTLMAARKGAAREFVKPQKQGEPA